MPNAKITALSPNKPSAMILSANKHIDNIYEYGLDKFEIIDIIKFFFKEYINLKRFFLKNHFDLFIIVHPNRFRSLLVKLLRYGASIENTANVHKTLEVLNILKVLGLDPVYDYSLNHKSEPVTLKKFGLSKKKYIIMDIYPQHLERDPRQWYYFNDLIERCKKLEQKIVLVGKNPYHMEKKDTVDLINKTSLNELLTLIKNAKLVVSLDSGIFHFSYSLKTPVIGIFGPVDPGDRLPFDKNLKADYLYTNEECSPCIVNRVDIKCKRKDILLKCMKEISADNVYKKILKYRI